MKTLEGDYAITALCEAFDVSRSGYYRWRNAGPTARAREDARHGVADGRVRLGVVEGVVVVVVADQD